MNDSQIALHPVVRHNWLPIETAPKDGTEIIVYCPPAHGLNHMSSVCSWHDDAGFCVCELREPTLWIPLPNAHENQHLPTAPNQD